MHLHEAMSLKSHSLLAPYNNRISTKYPTRILNFDDCRVLPTRRKRRCSVLNCRGVETSLPNKQGPLNFLSASLDDERPRNVGVAKDIDVSTFGNLCVDIVLDVPELPPNPLDQRKAFLADLSKSPPDQRFWEAGGNCNVAIASARLGLRCAAIGHVGNEIYGDFLIDVLRKEGINMVTMDEEENVVDSWTSAEDYKTLLCWVLVDPLHRHGFCSRADFSKDPVFSWMKTLSSEVKNSIRRSKILFCNGYDFDELSPRLLVSSLEYAVDVGTSLFFDPGPKGKLLICGTPDEREALNKFLRLSDVLLLTSDEAESLTGISNPIMAGKELLEKGNHTKWVVIKMGPKGSLLITMSSISCVPAFKVDVTDTVGCGDSFVAAIAFGFIHNLPLVHTLTMANAVGAATATGCGGGRNVASLDQVLKIMTKSNLNEDDRFWNEVFGKYLDTGKISMVSKGEVLKGRSNNQVHYLSLQKVIPEVLTKIEEAAYSKGGGGA